MQISRLRPSEGFRVDHIPHREFKVDAHPRPVRSHTGRNRRRRRSYGSKPERQDTPVEPLGLSHLGPWNRLA